MRRGDLGDLTAFVAVADNLSFRAAAARLGVTPSALRHTMRQLEERLRVRLLHRTTRSVSLTDAGRRLIERLRPAIDQIATAIDDLSGEQQRPYGSLRIHATHMAASAVIAPIWRRFLSMYPEVTIELGVDEARIDIVAQGFDAGIGPQDRAALDMIAVRVMGPMKAAVVGAPEYFARHSPPRMPEDLARHSCVQYRVADVAVCSSGRSSAAESRSGFRWMAGSSSMTPTWPFARRSTGWGSPIPSKLWRNRSCAQDSWSKYWGTGRPRSRGCSFSILGTGRSRLPCAPSSA
jgi:DNA-binding transcriptional LysR family regulator